MESMPRYGSSAQKKKEIESKHVRAPGADVGPAIAAELDWGHRLFQNLLDGGIHVMADCCDAFLAVGILLRAYLSSIALQQVACISSEFVIALWSVHATDELLMQRRCLNRPTKVAIGRPSLPCVERLRVRRASRVPVIIVYRDVLLAAHLAAGEDAGSMSPAYSYLSAWMASPSVSST